MKVLIGNKFFYLKGGSERVFFQEREFLMRRGIEVVDFSMQDPKNFTSSYSSYFVPNIDYYNCQGLKSKFEVGLKFIHSAQAVRNVKRLVEKEKPDIVHLHNIYHQITPSIIPTLKKYGVKIVMTLHDLKLVCPSYLMLSGTEVCEECKEGNYLRALLTHCQGSYVKETLLGAEAFYHKYAGSYDAVDLFICPSAFLKSQISARVEKARLVVLRNGVDMAHYIPSFEDEGYALYFGRLSVEKGVQTALRAHKELCGDLPLKIVGGGPLEGELQASYPRVEFLGFQTGKELKDSIKKASFVLVPSECYENCSMAVIEAMALGKPVIGTRMGGIPEQIDDGINGLLFNAGSVSEMAAHMSRLWRDTALRQRMGHTARLKVEREYSLEDHCQGLLELYTDLLNRVGMKKGQTCGTSPD